jgi:iron complex transport system permease protein
MSRTVLIGGLLAALALLCLLSVALGRVATPLAAILDPNDPAGVIIRELRIPRTILGVLVGAALGLSGAAMQGYTRNALADPGVLGVSSMAALGAVLVIYFGFTAASPWILPAAAMAGAGLGVLALLALAGRSSSIVTFILAGVIIQTVAGAAVALALNLAPNPWAVNDIVSWLMGSLADRSYQEVRLAAPFILAGGLVLMSLGRSLDALTLGDAGARSLGIDLGRTRVLLAVGAALAVGASVAVTGVISFVGLVTPHLVRPFVRHRPGALLLPSALAGSVLVVAADIVVRLTPSAAEVKMGVAMAVVGGPFFLALLMNMRRKLA